MLEDVPAPYLIPLVRDMTLFRQAGGETDWKKVGRNYPHLEEVSLLGSLGLTAGHL